MVGPVRREPDESIRYGARDLAPHDGRVERGRSDPLGRADGEDPRAAAHLGRTQAFEAAREEARFELVEIARDVIEDRDDADLVEPSDGRLERGEANRGAVAALDEIGAAPDGAVVPKVTLTLEQEAKTILVAEPSGDVRPKGVDAPWMNEQEPRALEAHEPLVAPARKVIDVCFHHVDRDH